MAGCLCICSAVSGVTGSSSASKSPTRQRRQFVNSCCRRTKAETSSLIPLSRTNRPTKQKVKQGFLGDRFPLVSLPPECPVKISKVNSVDVTVSDKMQCPAGDMETFQISPHTFPFRIEVGRTGTSEFVCSN